MATRRRSASLQGLQSAATGPGGFISTGNSPFEFGAFGPQSKEQGAFGRDLGQTDPQWAQWLDQTKAAGVGQFGADNEMAVNDPFWVADAHQQERDRAATIKANPSDARLATLRKASSLGRV